MQPTDENTAPQEHKSTAPTEADLTPDTQPIAAHEPKYKNILCVEDEHFIGELYTRALTKAGYNVNVVVDGADGVKEAMTDKYDIILLDIMVPTITGIEILKKIRGPEAAKLKAKIIITTNLEQKDDAKAEIERQADGYIVKAEVTPKQLVAFLQSLEK